MRSFPKIYSLYGLIHRKVKGVVEGGGGLRIVGDITYQKMYGWYGLKHHIVEISGDVTDADGRTDNRTNDKET